MFKNWGDRWHQVPKSFKIFFYRALGLLIIWKIIYLGFLVPIGIPDVALTRSVGVEASNVLNFLTNANNFSSYSRVVKYTSEASVSFVTQQAIFFKGINIVSIENGCNGLELCVLYIGFIISLPAKIGRKLFFTFLGVIVIYLINIIRCAGIAWLYIYYPKHADFTHHYVFVFFVYAFIIGLWLVYTKKLTVYAKA
jgi:exosortase/archaeosortase family protein